MHDTNIDMFSLLQNCPLNLGTVSNLRTCFWGNYGTRCLILLSRKKSLKYTWPQTTVESNKYTRYVGDKYAYRSADGSYNNPTLPWLGAANTEYARTIEPLKVRPASLPDPGLVFDSLFARDTFKPHPNNVSSVFFTWASLIIHGKRLNDPVSIRNRINWIQTFSKRDIQTRTSTRHLRT